MGSSRINWESNPTLHSFQSFRNVALSGFVLISPNRHFTTHFVALVRPNFPIGNFVKCHMLGAMPRINAFYLP